MESIEEFIDYAKSLIDGSKTAEVTIIDKRLVEMVMQREVTSKEYKSILNTLKTDYNIEGFAVQRISTTTGDTLIITNIRNDGEEE